MKTPVILLALLGFSAAACTTTTGNQSQVGPPIQSVEDRIAKAVEASAAANVAIAEVEVATAGPVRRAPSASVPADVVLPPEAVQPLTIECDGPVETFLAAISARSGYKLRVSGRPPANQVLLTLSAKDEPLYRVVREAGNQIHGHADISLNPSTKTIELRYGG